MSLIRVDFYLVASTEPDAHWLVACRLIEKVYSMGHKIYVHCNNQQDAENLDELLWTFRDDSFIPHNLQGEGPEPPPPVQIGHGNSPRGFNDVLLNMAADIPPFHTKFRRILEVVSYLEAEKEQSRIHYKYYKSRDYDLQTHAIEDNS
ncbi:MAG: DNA polymerase III subunit chi [Legionellales bacterium]